MPVDVDVIDLVNDGLLTNQTVACSSERGNCKPASTSRQGLRTAPQSKPLSSKSEAGSRRTLLPRPSDLEDLDIVAVSDDELPDPSTLLDVENMINNSASAPPTVEPARDILDDSSVFAFPEIFASPVFEPTRDLPQESGCSFDKMFDFDGFGSEVNFSSPPMERATRLSAMRTADPIAIHDEELVADVNLSTNELPTMEIDEAVAEWPSRNPTVLSSVTGVVTTAAQKTSAATDEPRILTDSQGASLPAWLHAMDPALVAGFMGIVDFVD